MVLHMLAYHMPICGLQPSALCLFCVRMLVIFAPLCGGPHLELGLVYLCFRPCGVPAAVSGSMSSILAYSLLKPKEKYTATAVCSKAVMPPCSQALTQQALKFVAPFFTVMSDSMSSIDDHLLWGAILLEGINHVHCFLHINFSNAPRCVGRPRLL